MSHSQCYARIFPNEAIEHPSLSYNILTPDSHPVESREYMDDIAQSPSAHLNYIFWATVTRRNFDSQYKWICA